MLAKMYDQEPHGDQSAYGKKDGDRMRNPR
jgi:hypothetical protein